MGLDLIYGLDLIAKQILHFQHEPLSPDEQEQALKNFFNVRKDLTKPSEEGLRIAR